MAKFEACQPWWNTELWNEIQKKKARQEQMKSIAAGVLGVNPNKVTVKNNFEEQLKKLNIPQSEIDMLK